LKERYAVIRSADFWKYSSPVTLMQLQT